MSRGWPQKTIFTFNFGIIMLGRGGEMVDPPSCPDAGTVDRLASGASVRKDVRVRVSLRAQLVGLWSLDFRL